MKLWRQKRSLWLSCCSVAQLCLTPCDPMDCSTKLPCPSLSPEVCSNSCPLSQWCIQACHPLSSPSPLALNLSQHHRLFQWVSSLHQVAKVLEFQLQHQSFQWIFRADFLYDWLVWSPCCLRDSQESSSGPQFKSINSLVLSFLDGPTLTSANGHWKACRSHPDLQIKNLVNKILRWFLCGLKLRET